MIRVLSVGHVQLIYAEQVRAGRLRDFGLLDGAVAAPYQNVFGHELYPTLAQKAGKLLEGIQRVQAYTDGNKRLAWLSTMTLLEMNGQTIMEVSASEVDGFVRGLVGVPDAEVKAALWLNDRLTSFS
ncbi:type II toxin-antitoxin system death-on-curing family toxin [Ornithinimicrobium cerasi]|uniref:type II toxin-antitoxin system death-on-curing family toxin n=1 Tax=Ornithinimicrobium cerasi TaxID=2248773 RepID=UPI00192A6D2B|nr:Fic family protein [Ornithinimicrobium cerasi]